MSRYAVAHLEEIDEITDGRCPSRPIRMHFGITSFGANAWTGREAGDRIVNEHDEAQEYDGQEELYLVQSGRASFELDGERFDAPAGTDKTITTNEDTAYTLAAHGPIIPLDAEILALTPISAFRPRRWRGALLSHSAAVRIDAQETDKRPVSAVADFTEVRDVIAVEIAVKRDVSITLLFDREANLEERVFKEQFLT